MTEKKQVRAILINSESRHIGWVTHEVDDSDAINSLIGSRGFTLACKLSENIVVYVDDEGLLKPKDQVKGAFQFHKGEMHSQVFEGNAIVGGVDFAGAGIDVDFGMSELESKLLLMQIQSITAWRTADDLPEPYLEFRPL